jgi:uncharacterized iron-regulated protein
LNTAVNKKVKIFTGKKKLFAKPTKAFLIGRSFCGNLWFILKGIELMFRLLFVLSVITLMTFSASAQITDANYRIYDVKGNPATLEQIIDSLSRADAIFLGENHDDAVAHYLQNKIFQKSFERYGKSRQMALSLEMFERDVQIVLDEYLKNLITENHFLLSSRPWKNYQTDYRPLVEFAKANNLPVIAANAPRRYVNMVSRGGRDSLNALSPEAKKTLAPLPFGEPSQAYADKFRALMKGAPEAAGRLENILASQSLWDATMAYWVSEYLRSQKNPLVIHLNGGFHTESRLGTIDHLFRYSPKARALVVTIKPEQNFTSFDKTKHENLGDFVILTDAKARGK